MANATLPFHMPNGIDKVFIGEVKSNVWEGEGSQKKTKKNWNQTEVTITIYEIDCCIWLAAGAAD